MSWSFIGYATHSEKNTVFYKEKTVALTPVIIGKRSDPVPFTYEYLHLGVFLTNHNMLYAPPFRIFCSAPPSFMGKNSRRIAVWSSHPKVCSYHFLAKTIYDLLDNHKHQ